MRSEKWNLFESIHEYKGMSFSRRNLKKIKAVIIIAIACLSVLIIAYFPVVISARAVLISPRLGAAIQGPSSAGPSLNQSEYLNGTITIYISPDPVEAAIPSDWKNIGLWSVALTPSVLPTANCTVLTIEKIVTGPCSFVLFGGGMDTNPLYPTSIGLVCKIPANIAPVTYNLAVGFRNKITPEKQQSGEINLTPSAGSWQGSSGSATNNPFGSSPSFLLLDADCVSIPWVYDAKSSDSPGKTYQRIYPVNPFTILQVTDTHYAADNSSWLKQNALWANDSEVLDPDLIVLTGDLVENPYAVPSDMQLAYNSLTSLGLPLRINSGNHDQKLMGLWEYYIGPLYATTKFDDVSVISFDSNMPFGNGILNWIRENAKNDAEQGPTFLACHYPTWNYYFPAGWMSITNIMMKYNVTGIMVGHTHADMVAPLIQMYNAMGSSNNLDALKTYLLNSEKSTFYLHPVTQPMMFMTRSSAKTLDYDPFNYGLPHYSGYRKFTVTNDEVSNYTYDYNGDGVRDPDVCTPNGLLKTSLTLDPGIGVNISAGATWRINSSMNEVIPAARAIFEVPSPPTGTHWDLIGANKTNGAYIRTQITDGSHCWIDARLTVPANSMRWLRLEAVA